MSKFNMGLFLDKIFRRTIFLRPLPDKTLEVVDITGMKELYLNDTTGATAIDPACVVRVRGLKRVDYIAMKLSSAPTLLNIFDSQKLIVEPPPITVSPPDIIVAVPEHTLHHPNIIVTVPPTKTTCPNCNQEHEILESKLEVSIPDTPVTIPDITAHVPAIEVSVPKVDVIFPSEHHIEEKFLGDMLNFAEIAGRMQAETNPEKDKKMTWILILAGAAVLVGVLIFFKMQG